jgi:hypothetical protein
MYYGAFTQHAAARRSASPLTIIHYTYIFATIHNVARRHLRKDVYLQTSAHQISVVCMCSDIREMVKVIYKQC